MLINYNRSFGVKLSLAGLLALDPGNPIHRIDVAILGIVAVLFQRIAQLLRDEPPESGDLACLAYLLNRSPSFLFEFALQKVLIHPHDSRVIPDTFLELPLHEAKVFHYVEEVFVEGHLCVIQDLARFLSKIVYNIG